MTATYSQTIELVTGDTLPSLVVTLKDANSAATGKTLDPADSDTWAPVVVTGAVPRLRIREVNTTTVLSTITGNVSDGANGIVAYALADDTFPDAGTYEGEVEVTFVSGLVQTVVQLIKFKVREGFA